MADSVDGSICGDSPRAGNATAPVSSSARASPSSSPPSVLARPVSSRLKRAVSGTSGQQEVVDYYRHHHQRPSPTPLARHEVLVVTAHSLENETGRVYRELDVLGSLGFSVTTIEPTAFYLGSGERGTVSRRLKRDVGDVKRVRPRAFTLPVAAWLSGGWMKRMLLFVIEPILLMFNLVILFASVRMAVAGKKVAFAIVHNAPDLGAIVVRLVTAGRGIPYIYEYRDAAPVLYSRLSPRVPSSLTRLTEATLNPMESFASKGAFATITVGQAMADRLRREHGVSNCLIAYGSVASLGPSQRTGGGGWGKGGELKRELVLGYSGQAESARIDYQVLLGALELLSDAGRVVKLKVIGNVSLDVKSMLAAAPADVEVIPWMKWGQYMSYLSSNCDAGVIPFKTTPLNSLAAPNKLFDYMAAGLPIVVPALPGFAEFVADGVNGYLYRPGSARSLADALTNLYDPLVRAALGLESRRLFDSRFCEEIQATKLRSLFIRAAGGSSQR
jgi:glycosyltransferase involved in cell wall biosynthesis